MREQTCDHKKREKDSRERPRRLEKCRQTGPSFRIKIQRIHERETENQRAQPRTKRSDLGVPQGPAPSAQTGNREVR